jgi:chromosome segregation ATPase
MAGTVFSGCKSPVEKQENARNKVQDAEQDLNTAQKDALEIDRKVATAEEWRIFRSESEQKINDNVIRIAELKVKMKKPGEIFDALYEKRITGLEKQNLEMKAKLDAYEKSQSNWETFKREFNHDMDELGKALKDLTVDNKK